MKTLLFLLLTLFCYSLFAQSTISGKVIDQQGTPIMGANVYLSGTYDGTATNENGLFTFETTTTGTQTLIASSISFETYSNTDDIANFSSITIKLKDDVNTLDAVTVNAGTFNAGDNAKVTALKPLDIVTTAGALGDFVGALQTLPGTSNVAEDGRLFVRGGDAEETQIFVDGMRVFTPYSPSANNIPARGRLSPFLFKGITFSTGGYSAEYGQALSSVLLLNSINEPQEEKTEISIMTVGFGLGNTKKWKKSSLSINTSYINLAPYQKLYPDNNEWHKPIESVGGEAVYRYKFNNDGLLKVYGAYSSANFDLTQEDINEVDGIRFGLKNRNLYINTSYQDFLEKDWSIATGVSFANDRSEIKYSDADITDVENSAHLKIAFKKFFSSRYKLNFGAEYFATNFTENYLDTNFENDFELDNNILSSFIETDVFFSKKFATKIGIRGEYSELLQEFTISPRLSLAYKAGTNSQFSLAYGEFFQNPKNDYLKYSSDFIAENTTHYIANYQYVKNKQIFRAEAYYKNYGDLVKYDTPFALPTSTYNNEGSGYAKGLDIFWRDNKSIKNTEYWMSYSYLDTERDYQNYPTSATPDFASKHNASLVVKRWVEDWKSQVGFSYNYASGRTYTDPNKGGFLTEQAKSFNSLNVNYAYLISPQKILYLSVSNVLGTKNVNGYQYADQTNMDGIFDRRTITPAADRFFFIGFFWTISDNKNDNQLDNL
ncbi:carboxypeptidase-like regulatory domain-containing protein [Maribacter sp. SA7]|uniref:TonB-dependent receptor n=1 Tax=Maribacter zhoushanensis TaxID=3030012 RepID=UPI0023ED3AB3|nr:carboxypeptidase-like regulatory domain-containing protein [Maribacter zhoushanensis]MDF4203326.1 carboxypeptidase-like regulatory domain-containing protein [Maribacter zhoushanensis]